jgi:glycosyltransferase involved in cell wall biosynthesis
MHIVQLTPGTGSFHCGSCLRDNTLVRALRAMGHDVQMVPLYLPTVVEGEAADDGQPLFFGGINVYLQQKSSLFRHTPRLVDRLLDAPALLRWLAGYSSMTSAGDLGELTISMLRGDHGLQRKELDRLIDWLRTQPRPDVVCLSNALLMGVAPALRRELGVPIVCSLQGEDGFIDGLPPEDAQRVWELLAQLSVDVDAFIAVSRYYADVMQQRANLPADRVHVAHNGIDVTDLAPAESPVTEPVIGYLARMCAFKGLHTLIDAFIELNRRGNVKDARLLVGGAQLRSDQPYVDELRRRLGAAGLADRAQFMANITREKKCDLLRRCAVFSVPATYGEAFGLYVLEAMACGVPVVAPRHAVFPELLARAPGGVLCEPDDAPALAESLEHLLLNRAEAQQLGARGHAAVLNEFADHHMARRVAAILQQVVDQPHEHPTTHTGADDAG